MSALSGRSSVDSDRDSMLLQQRTVRIGEGRGPRRYEASAVAKSPEQAVSNREVAEFKSCRPLKALDRAYASVS